MRVADALQGITRLFLDTGPVIYFVEANPTYFPRVQPIFDRVAGGSLLAVTSPITLAECLVYPIRTGLTQLQKNFTDLIVGGRNTSFVEITGADAIRAAQTRAKYKIALPDALQFAVAISAKCDVLLTNDVLLKRVTELHVIVMDDLES